MSLDYVSVLVPYRPDYGWRDAAWRWIRPRWLALGVDLVEESPGPGASPAEFNHPLAINAARRRAKGEVLIVADADTSWDPGWVESAARRVRSGEETFVLPSEYWQLTREQTTALRDYELAPEYADEALAEWVGYGVSWAGLVVVAAETFDAAYGYDERFAWWGSDDGAFALAVQAIADARPFRLPGRALHHWHPRPEEMHPHQGENHALMRRYVAAAGDGAAMTRVRLS
jgi:Glycosyl transferase family 2